MMRIKKAFIGKSDAVLCILAVALVCFGCDNVWPGGKKTAKKAQNVVIDHLDPAGLQTVRVNNVEYTVIDSDRTEWARKLYLSKDFFTVQAHLLELLKNSAKDKSDELFALYGTLSRIPDKKHIDLMISVLNEWCTIAPDSHVPWLVRGNFYTNWAWIIRGRGWSKDVPKDAWPKFYEKLALAQKDLEYAYRLNSKDPNAPTFLIKAAKGLGYAKDVMEKYYQWGIEAYPGHTGLHMAKLDYLTPKWHGTEEEMLAFAQESYKKIDQYPRLGLVLVRAYEEIQKERDEEYLLGRDDIWRIVKSVYENLFRLYPDNLRFHFSYAYYAVSAGKSEEALKQFELIGDRWSEETAWVSLKSYNTFRGSTYYDIGRDLLFEKHLYPMFIDYFESALHYKPTAASYYGLGIAYWYTGNSLRDVSYLLKAEDALKKAVEINPKHKQARQQLKNLQDMLQKGRSHNEG